MILVVLTSAAPADLPAAEEPAWHGQGDRRAVAAWSRPHRDRRPAWLAATMPPVPRPRARRGRRAAQPRRAPGAEARSAPRESWPPRSAPRRQRRTTWFAAPRAHGPGRRRRADRTAAATPAAPAASRARGRLRCWSSARDVPGARRTLPRSHAADDSGVVAARDGSDGAVSDDAVCPRGASDHAAAARRLAAIALTPANHRRRARSASARCFCASAACAARSTRASSDAGAAAAASSATNAAHARALCTSSGRSGVMPGIGPA